MQTQSNEIKVAAIPRGQSTSLPQIPQVQFPKVAGKELERAGIKARSSTQSLEEKLLSYLGRGCSNEDAAAACGISVSRVTQISTVPEFAAKLEEERFKHATQYIERDSSWDSAEDKLLEKLHEVIPTMHKPAEILSALRIVNGAARRAPTSPDQVTAAKTTVNLILPTVALSRFVANSQNQVVQAGSQSLVTIQSGVLANMASASVQGEINERLLTQEISSGQGEG